MTDAHSIAQQSEPEVSPANNHKLTVGYASRYPDYSRIPAITMKGQWLETAGFVTGTPVDVKVMEGCIVLTALQESELDAVAASGMQAVGAETKAGAGVYSGYIW